MFFSWLFLVAYPFKTGLTRGLNWAQYMMLHLHTSVASVACASQTVSWQHNCQT
jgi:hypothetical protein